MYRALACVLVLGSIACDGPAGPTPLIGPNGILEDMNPDPGILEVAITAAPAQIDLGDGRTHMMLAYNGRVPGPAIEAHAGDHLIVHFTNQLDQPTTIHWHGLRISDTMDGSPLIQHPVDPGGTFTYDFTIPEASTFWFHPHVQTNVQLESGMHAPFIVHGDSDPHYDAERVLVLDDILLDETTGELAPFLATRQEELLGRWGNHLLTNGSMSPDSGTARQGQVERWRIINVASARTMHLSIENARWRIIATDGGLLHEPYEQDELEISTAKRYDLEVSYDSPGAVRLISRLVDRTTGETTMQPVYTVDAEMTGIAPRAIVWPDIADIPNRTADEMVEMQFAAMIDPVTNELTWTINGEAHRHEPLFTFPRGRTVRMHLNNLSSVEHPFHLHGQFFSVADPPARGLHDTVLVPPSGQTVDILAYLDNPGSWMAHCHNLEHAELGMMTVILVTP